MAFMEVMDYTKLEGPELLHECGNDADKWAEAFCQHHKHVSWDEAMPWFANAIVHSLDLERGTVINGEHAAYLVEHGRSPTSQGHDA